MRRIGSNLQKRRVIMALLTLVLMNTGCDERFDNPAVNPSEGEMVEVTLNIGFADESDAAALPVATTTRQVVASNNKEAFDVQLIPATQTKAATTSHPDQLYNLEIYQYDGNGNYLACTSTQTINPGTSTATLNVNTSQMLIIARGDNSTVAAFKDKSLSDVRKLVADAELMKAITTDGNTNINDMPYLLYLPKVKITDGKLQSPEGTDVRLLLKRLAVGLTIDWTFSQAMTKNGYSLTEVRLMQIPADYRILPERETETPYGEMYPVSTSNFIDGFRLKGDDLTKANGTQTLWMPANARGTRSDVTAVGYRNKNYAHPAATYVEFVVDNTGKNERLLYRAYLGGNATSDFNLYENTNYYWKININNANYTSDNRIQLLDQTPVKSDNLQPTSNCFMMRPGTNICFNPYLHEAGAGGQNTYLSDKTIDKVEVLWQSKDAGTSGDLVLGYAGVNDQTNLVNYTDIGDKTNARVHVKVPNTNGGNAVIAAYNSQGTIVWSWHLWITDYVPAQINGAAIGDESSREVELAKARNASVGGTVHQYRGSAWTYPSGNFYNRVIMDRNLGALRNTWSTTSSLDAARAYGNLYQWGRKDPMPGSADGGRDDIDLMFDGDGVSKPLSVRPNSELSRDNTIQNPAAFYKLDDLKNANWLPDDSWSASKTIYDPCPAGWQVPDFTTDAANNIWSDFNTWTNMSMLVNGSFMSSSMSVKEKDFHVMNGMRYKIAEGDYVWLPFIRMREMFSGLLRDPYRNSSSTGETIPFASNLLPCFVLYGAGKGTEAGRCWYLEFKYVPSAPTRTIAHRAYGFGIRCIQDRK
mgnify:CR=1 FL=1